MVIKTEALNRDDDFGISFAGRSRKCFSDTVLALPLRVQQHTRIYDYWRYEDKRPTGARERIDSLILISTDTVWMEIGVVQKRLCCQSACPYWRSCIIDDAFVPCRRSKLCVMTAESSETSSSWNIEACIELPAIASVLSSCSSLQRSPKPFTNTRMQASCLRDNSISACLFRCGLSRIDTRIVLFLPINVKLCETRPFRSGGHISRRVRCRTFRWLNK